MAVTETGHLASREVDDLYRRHGSDVYRYAYAVLGNHADAEDVTQTTFLNAYRALGQGVRPRKPANWLLAIASNAIKQRFRAESARPRQVELDERTAAADTDEPEGPTVGELLAALSKIPPQQRQAIVLREFEGRSYVEIAEILGVTTSALETLLFRARRSLAEELEHQLTCTDAQLAISRAADGRLGRKERRRLREHLAECPECTRFASVQQRHRRALKGLLLLPVPLSLHFLKGIEGTASAAGLPAAALPSAAAPVSALPAAAGTGVAAGAGAATAVGAGSGLGAALGAGAGATTTGGFLASGAAVKAAAVVAAVALTGGVAVTASSESGARHGSKAPASSAKPGARIGQVAPRGVLVPGNGVARGKAAAPGQTRRGEGAARHSASGTSAARHSNGHGTGKARSNTGHSARASHSSSHGAKAAKTGAAKSSSAKAPTKATSSAHTSNGAKSSSGSGSSKANQGVSAGPKSTSSPSSGSNGQSASSTGSSTSTGTSSDTSSGSGSTGHGSSAGGQHP